MHFLSYALLSGAVWRRQDLYQEKMRMIVILSAKREVEALAGFSAARACPEVQAEGPALRLNFTR
jgi:hypothetical protein